MNFYNRIAYCCVAILILVTVRVVIVVNTAWFTDYSQYLLYYRQVDQSQQQRIPSILHHTWKDENIPEDWQHVRKHCLDLHPKFKRILWTDKLSRDFIATDFPWFLPTYDSYWYDIQRADVIRYFVLYKYGGIYLDLDVGCREKLNFFLPYTFILPATAPVGFSNDVIMSVPGHQFLAFLITSLKSWNFIYGTKYLTVFFSTGPALVSYHMNRYLSVYSTKGVPKQPTSDKNSTHSTETNIRESVHFTDDVSILDQELYNNNKEYSFFYHVKGNSWHGWDVQLVNIIVKYWYFCIFIVLSLLLAWFLWKMKRQSIRW